MELRANESAFSRIEWGVGGLFLLALAAYTARKVGVHADDAWITLSYALNLAEGRGMVFQEGERVLGTTTPLWCWLHAGLMTVVPSWREAAQGAVLLAVASHFAAALALMRFGVAVGLGRCAWLAGVCWLLLPGQIHIQGMEHGLATALVLETLLAWKRGRPLVAGGLAAGLCLVRPEATLLAMIVFGAWCLPVGGEWVVRRRQAMLYALPIAVVGVLALGGFQLYYGSPVPNTLAGKQEQLGGVAWAINIGAGVWQHVMVEWLRGAMLVALLMVAGGVAMLARLRGEWDVRGWLVALVVGWAVIQISVLSLMGIPYYGWYIYPVWIVAVLFVAGGLERVVAMEGALGIGRAPVFSVAIALLVVVGFQENWSGNPSAWQRGRFGGYRQLAESVNAQGGGESAEVLSPEIGVLRYFLGPEHRVVDEMLLVTENPTPGRFPLRDDFVRIYRPRFLVESHPYHDSHSAELRAIQEARRTDEEIELFYADGEGGAIMYDMAERVVSVYGVQILFELRGEE